MKYKIAVISEQNDSNLNTYLSQQLHRHFAAWCNESRGSNFSLRWMENTLFLITNSEYLVRKWFDLEKEYVDYVLGIDVQEERMLQYLEAA